MFEPLETSKIYKRYDTVLRGVYRTNQAEYADRINVEYRWFDPYRRQLTTKKVNDNSAGFKQLSRRKINIPSSTAKFEVLRAKDKTIFNEVALSDWSKTYYEMFDFVVLTEEPQCEVNRIIEVNITDPEEKKALPNGR